MREMISKYHGTCNGCKGHIRKGELIKWSRKTGAYHSACAPSGNRQDDSEYWQGRAQGNRRAIERQIYGAELVEQWDIEADMRSAY